MRTSCSVAARRALIASLLLATASCSRRVSGPVGAPSDLGRSPAEMRSVEKGDPRAHVPGAQTTIARKMPQFRRCFERLDVTGKISLVLTIGREGQVHGASAQGRVPREVAQCVEAKALTARFSPPEGNKLAQLHVPLMIYDQ